MVLLPDERLFCLFETCDGETIVNGNNLSARQKRKYEHVCT